MEKKDIIEKLKRYWKVDELKFVAKFHRPKREDGSFVGNFGFFNHFMIYETGKTIYYPRPENVDDFESRISFKQPLVDDLINDNLYLIELELDNDTNSNNPYQLKIKGVIPIDQEQTKKDLETNKQKNKLKDDILNSLMDDNNIKENLFYGQYKLIESGDGFFKKIISVEEGNLLLHEGRRQDVFLSKKILTLSDGDYYKFRLASIKKKENKLYFFIDTNNPPQKIDLNPYKETIRLRYERLDNPESNKMIANLMREIGKGLYSSKQRMIFELLQNADDAPADDSVQFHIDAFEDYFLVMHNGVPFNKDDVEAITSAAESTKRNDKKKTGYKGIGFKSVFTDSEEVIINSGGFSFAFQKLNPAFQSFDEFYFNKERYKKYPDLLEEDKLKFKKQRIQFNGVRDIPWQVVPIWQNGIPEQIINTNFAKYDNNVKFAIKFGSDKIPGYLGAIDDFTSSPHFILFLRNTNFFRSPKNGVTIEKIGENPVIIKRNARNGDKKELLYFKNDIENISVSNESFKDLGIDILKNNRENDYGEVTYFFENSKGIELDNIPPKLASIDKTQITFAIPIEDGSIIAERKYLKNITYSSLFTYLPMEETRFQLPFLVNADFVPSSDRESIQGDNPWNIYIMAKIAEQHVIMIESFASKFLEIKKSYKNYLSLLLKELFSDNNTAQEIIDIYNRVYYDKLKNTSIIVADNEQIMLLKETIIDSSGITKIFGNNLFYKIIDTAKRLPHKDLCIKYLQYEYLEIEKVDLENLISKFDNSNLQLFEMAVLKLSIDNYNDLLTWLNKVAALDNFADQKFGDIPFIRHDKSIYSINDLIDLEDAWVMNHNIEPIKEVIKELGYDVINLNLEKHHNIDYFIKDSNNYTNKPELAYERISENDNLCKLKPENKAILISFLKDSDFMKGIGETKFVDTLKLFNNKKGVPSPLSKLITPSDAVNASSLKDFAILNEEYKLLELRFTNKVISEAQIFQKFFLDQDLYANWAEQFNSTNIDQHASELDFWFKKAEDVDQIAPGQWVNIPWLYINDENRFKKSSEVYCPDSLYNLAENKYNSIRDILNHKFNVANYHSATLVKQFNLKCESGTITGRFTPMNNLKVLETNDFLDWLEVNGEIEFFNHWTFTKNDSNRYSLDRNNNKIYNSQRSIHKYIQNDENLGNEFIPLTEDLCSATRDKLGLLEGEKLLLKIIETENYKQDLAMYFPEDLPDHYYKLYIQNLETFNLETSSNYDKTSPEHKALSWLLSQTKEDSNSLEWNALINELRKKIFINNNTLSQHNIVDKVSFKIGEIKFDKLKLSDILPGFKGNTDILSEIIESFSGIKAKHKLQKNIFKTELMSYSKIYTLIKESDETFLTPHQLVFMLLYRKHERMASGKEIDFPKEMFDDYYNEINDNQKVFDGYKVMLDLLLDLEFYDIDGFNFFNTDFKKLVLSDTKIPEEEIPIWLQEWISANNIQNRIECLSKLGLNTENSDIVNYRKAMIAKPFDIDKVYTFYGSVKENKSLLWNSIIWLSKFSSEIITQNIQIIKKTITEFNIALKLTKKSVVYLPVVEQIKENNTYKLILIKDKDELHSKNQYWGEWEKDIFNYLHEKGKFIIDFNLPGKAYNFLTHFYTKPKIEIDKSKLESSSSLFNELYYKKWSLYSEYKIYIFNGEELPKIVTYNEDEIKKISRGKSCFYNDAYYITTDLKDNLLSNLPEEFPEDKLLNLKEWERRTLKDSSLLDDYDHGYSESIERILRDKFGLNERDQRSKSQESKAAAIYFLKEQGYDISGIKNIDYMIEGLIDPHGHPKKCVVSSAEGGLMHIKEYFWSELKNEEVFLLTMYPGGTPRIFNTQQELLDEELNEYLLFRVRNSKSPEDIDKVFENLNKEGSHLLMVTSQDMKTKLYMQLEKGKTNKALSDPAIADEEFTY